jgi:hypothetical protein
MSEPQRAQLRERISGACSPMPAVNTSANLACGPEYEQVHGFARSSPCRPSPVSSPNGACAGSGSTTTSRPSATSTAFPMLRAQRGRGAPDRRDLVKGERIAVHMRSSGNGKRPPAIAVTPTGPSALSAGTPPSLLRQPWRSAISSMSDGLTPSRASDPASASCAWRGRSVSHGWRPPPDRRRDRLRRSRSTACDPTKECLQPRMYGSTPTSPLSGIRYRRLRKRIS